MRRVLGSLVCAVVLLAGFVGSAEATVRRTPPSAPRSLAVTGTGQPVGSVKLTWRAPRTSGSAPITSYRVSWALARTHAVTHSRTLPARARSTVLALTAGSRYVVHVSARNRWGRSPSARVTFLVARPAAHVDSLVAVDTADHTLVRLPLTGGTETVLVTGLTQVSDLATDPSGNAYLVDDGAVREVSPTGTSTALGAGRAVETDAAGNVYVLGTGGVTRRTPAGATTRVSSRPGDFLAVQADGQVTVGEVNSINLTLTTYGAGAPVTRVVGTTGYATNLLDDDHGRFYTKVRATGGSGATWWSVINPGASDALSVSTRLAENGGTVGPDGRFFLAQSVSFCAGLGEQTGSCTPDRNVPELLSFPPSATTPATVPVTGLRTTRDEQLHLAADRGGQVYAAQLGTDPGLLRFAAGGGAPTRLAQGTFGLLAVG
ncbi:MAG: hypothetical protein JWP61_1203 [Friedmanniella sp.]|nr:hypothetical protein [Friedmanniella sp.]